MKLRINEKQKQQLAGKIAEVIGDVCDASAFSAERAAGIIMEVLAAQKHSTGDRHGKRAPRNPSQR